MAVVQNVFEKCGGTGPLASFGGSTGNSTNVLIYNNVFVGERIADMYENHPANSNVMNHIFIRNNYFDLVGYKTDTTLATDGNRINNWPVMWQVGCSGNYYAETRVSSAAGQFPPEFFGLNSYHPVGSGTNLMDVFKWTSRKSNGAVSATGGGNYRPFSDSPGFRDMGCAWLLPFDLDGFSRSNIDPPGAYSSGNLQKGFATK
jgi:hypothetical protein